ncbi:MAG: ATP-binding protein [Candidatus Obscuribacterales bacterium]|nr:ATP-binding protein [Cyanobacteria bacterium SZAS LIN-5]RTL42457.1 MAG: ATP-binding protein [Candidatus Melainabacteria bacterium]
MTFSGFNMKDLVPANLLPKDLRTKIYEHMGKDPATLSIVTEQFDRYNQANLQIAIDELTTKDGRTCSILGIQGGFLNNLTGTSLADLVASQSVASFVGLGGAKEGTVQYLNMELDGGKKLACVQGGLYLINGNPKLVLLLRQGSMMDFANAAPIVVDVMAENRATAEKFIKDIQRLMGKNNIYRGKMLSVIEGSASSVGSGGGGTLKFHTVPVITREQIILPEGLLKRIERQTTEVGKYSEALKNAGRKLKRGILLHGKPGTGKTMTAMYLASAMRERTVLLVTGRGQGLISRTCFFARWLAPSMVIIEDVDLIAEDRSQQGNCNQHLLLELMNEMDGLSDDVDVLFVLTTNRPEILEPALAARPGRIDQAYEVPLPDAECRKRLFEVYSKGLTVKVDNMDVFIKRTAGASGAFIGELMRKAALFAAPDGDPIVVSDRHLDEAMHEMVVAGGSLTKSLLGSKDIGFVPSELSTR